MPTQQSPITQADHAAVDAAARAGAVVRPLESLEEMAAVPDLIRRVWQPQPFNMPLSTDMVAALSMAGCYAVGAWAEDRLVGAAVGMFDEPGAGHLHSHIAVVDPDLRGRGVGTAMKLHQRAWAMEREVRTVTWTFDPLVRRNAFLNLGKLGGVVREYKPNLYGLLPDTINGHDESDRLLATWDLASDRVADAVAALASPSGSATSHRPLPPGIRAALSVGEDGMPRPERATGSLVTVDIPGAIADVRSSRPDVAFAWRHAVRDVLGGLLDRGAIVVGFDRARGYVVRRDGAQP